MNDTIAKYKGVHPGKTIELEYIKRDTNQRELARNIGVHFQTLNAVINGRRKLTMEFADKLDDAFQFESGTFWILQAYYEVEVFHGPKNSKNDLLETILKIELPSKK